MGKEKFSYRATKDGKVFVYWHGGGRETIFKRARASRLLARATGNFKRGNERPKR